MENYSAVLKKSMCIFFDLGVLACFELFPFILPRVFFCKLGWKDTIVDVYVPYNDGNIIQQTIFKLN